MIGLITGVLSLFLIFIRVVESIYELRKNPELDTWGECVQVVRNFFKLEKYDGK